MNGSYERKSFATDDPRRNVAAYAVLHGTRCGYGGPCHSTGKTTSSDDVYIGPGIEGTWLGVAADRFSAEPTII